MKLSKEELKAKINEVVTDEDLKISLLEDIEDSVDVADDTEKVERSAYDELEIKYNELKEKYKERFLSSDTKEEEKEETEELKEDDTIDVKEIFEDKEGE